MPVIAFTVPLPPSTNALFSNAPGHGRAKTKAYAKWLRQARLHLMAEGVRLPLPMGRYRMDIAVPWRMRGDISNRIKAIEDLCVKAGLLVDDRYAIAVAIRRERGLAEDVASVALAEWEFDETETP